MSLIAKINSEEDTVGPLQQAIRDALKARGWTQERLAGEVGYTKQWVNSVVNGQRLPKPETLRDIHDKLGVQDPLAVWLLWLFQQQVAEVNVPAETGQAITSAIEDAVGKLTSRTAKPRQGFGTSLQEFPHAFQPLTVICGDRREATPKTSADLLVYSVAITDLMFLLNLGIDDPSAVIRSDKLFVLMDENELKKQFGNTNLLVIGSPAVNYAARLINNYSIFRFVVTLETRNWVKQASFLRGLRDDDTKLLAFWRAGLDPGTFGQERIDPAVDDPEVRRLRDEVAEVIGHTDSASFMNDFRKAGFIDPADGKVHGSSTHSGNDFAVISMAPNPFADDGKFVAILVGGIHGPGTAQALKWLGTPDNFKSHPYGGVLEVHLNPFAEWSFKLERATTEWQTSSKTGYTGEQVLANLQAELAERRRGGKGTFPMLLEDEVEQCVAFVQGLVDPAQTKRA